MEKEQILFKDNHAFRNWLVENHFSNKGIWLIFGKKNGPETLSYDQALEEALCFGWIDGLLKRIDDKTYIQYFAPRQLKSKWSVRNKALVGTLEVQGKMTDAGRSKIEEAKKNGSWDAEKPKPISQVDVDLFVEKIKDIEPAFSHFMNMSPSIKRTYTAWYLDAKSEQTKTNRLHKIIDRLNNNLKPM